MELEGRGAGGVAGGPAAGPGRSPGESALLDGWLQRGVGRGAGGGEAGACRPPVRQDSDTGPDYETLPAGATVTTHMVAGAVAGILEHCVMYPIDCVKVRPGPGSEPNLGLTQLGVLCRAGAHRVTGSGSCQLHDSSRYSTPYQQGPSWELIPINNQDLFLTVKEI